MHGWSDSDYLMQNFTFFPIFGHLLPFMSFTDPRSHRNCLELDDGGILMQCDGALLPQYTNITMCAYRVWTAEKTARNSVQMQVVNIMLNSLKSV